MGQKHGKGYREVVEKQIREHPVLMYSTGYCGYCVKAKQVFQSINVKPFVVDLDKHPDGEEIAEALVEITRQDTVPCIFIGGKHLGGFTQLVKGLQTGYVQSELRRVNVMFEEFSF